MRDGTRRFRFFNWRVCMMAGGDGTIHRIEIDALTEQRGLGPSHALGLPAADGIAQALGRMPERPPVLGIEGAEFRTGSPLTPAVAAAVDECVAVVRRVVAAQLTPDGG